jgi:micrococcal nuclease
MGGDRVAGSVSKASRAVRPRRLAQISVSRANSDDLQGLSCMTDIPPKGRDPRRSQDSKTRGRKFTKTTLVAAMIALMATTTFASDRPFPLSQTQQHPPALYLDSLAARFTICGETLRVNCVVDGDTFWHLRVKIRIADIDAPELSPPRCEAERIKGEAAKRRLLTLLNAGPFSLVVADRDEDRFGRKLRVVMRIGHSLGSTLVAEGLARPWGGPRRSWCD